MTRDRKAEARDHLIGCLTGLGGGGGHQAAADAADAIDRYLAAVLHGWVRRADVNELVRRTVFEAVMGLLEEAAAVAGEVAAGEPAH